MTNKTVWDEESLELLGKLWPDPTLRVRDIADQIKPGRSAVGKKGLELYGPRPKYLNAVERAGITKEILDNLLMEGKTTVQIADQYGISKNSVAEARKRYGLTRSVMNERRFANRKSSATKRKLQAVRGQFGSFQTVYVPKPIPQGSGFRIMCETGQFLHMSGEKPTDSKDAAWRGTGRQALNMISKSEIDGLKAIPEKQLGDG